MPKGNEQVLVTDQVLQNRVEKVQQGIFKHFGIIPDEQGSIQKFHVKTISRSDTRMLNGLQNVEDYHMKRSGNGITVLVQVSRVRREYQ